MKFLEKLQRELERIGGSHEVSVSITLDEAGYLDRVCPKEQCARGFKLMHADLHRVGDEAWCIYCGHKGPRRGFATEGQDGHARDTARDHARKLVNEALRRAAMSTPSRTETYGSKYNSVTITQSSTPPPIWCPPTRVPPEAWAIMRVEARCAQCTCRFAGIGGVFFCTACGFRSPDQTFDETLRRVRDGMMKRAQLEVAIGVDVATDLLLRMAESDVQSLVSAFEAFAKESFPRLAPTAPPPPPNVFQNLRRGSELWEKHGGRAFTVILAGPAYAELARFFQQRHILVHANGIVDKGYVTNTGDTTYTLGQRLVIKPDHVVRMADLVMLLVAGLRADLP